MLSWFLGATLSALAASVLYPIVRFLTPPREAEAATEEVEVGPTNAPQLLDQGYQIIRFGAEPVIVVRVSAEDIRAFSATCTHLDCIVGYRKSRQRIWCNCHNGVYDLQGRNVGGPPPRPLRRYRVNLVSRGAGQAATIVVSRS